MTENDKIKTVQTLIGDCDEATTDTIAVYLKLAESAILKRLYPFGAASNILPQQYEMDQCELAVRFFNRRGAEGETSHSENSITRTYGTVNDEDILSRIVPFAKVM